MADAEPDIGECLQLQLSEVEMLNSMFPSEFTIDDHSVVSDVQAYIDGEMTEVPRQLSFTIKIHLDDPKCDVEICCQFSSTYPEELPKVFARSDALSRQPQKELNDDLMEHLMDMDRGELCVGEVVQWIQDNVAGYVVRSQTPSETSLDRASKKLKSEKDKADDTFTRLWIHSHHIYSKTKRKNILDMGGLDSLTGFCLPGKPGIICIEGHKDDVEDMWAQIRRWNWKKISCKHREDVSLREGEIPKSVDDFRCFQGFEEKVFDVRGGRDYHMDLGLFFKFLEERNCAPVFKVLLGVDGKTSEN